MAREPELSIKVKVDPQIKPSELKTDIERKVKQSGEKPQIDIDPNVDGIKKKVEDKLKNIKATANITPVVDTEKLKTDIQQQINGIGDIPKVTVGVNVDDFSSELTKQLKDQLKEVNQQLSYYLKNLTSNTDRLGSFANDIFSTKDLKASTKQVANEVSDEFVGGLSGTFNINDLLNYKISDTTKKKNLSQVENLVNEIKDIWAGLYADNWLDDDKININAFNDQFTQLGSKAKELKSILDSVYSAFDSDKFKDKLDIFNTQGFDLNKNLKEFMSIDDFLDEIIDKSKVAFKTTDQAMDFSKLINGLTGDNKISFNSVLDNVSGELGNVHAKISEINSSAKAVKAEIKDVQKEANAAQKTDTSGHLDASTIETYGQKLDEVLSNIADKQNAINDARKTAVDLERNILAATVLTREGLSNELTQYEALFKKFDTDKIAKFAETTNLAEFIKNQEIKMQAAQGSGEKNQIEDGIYNVKDVKFDIDPSVLQLKVDAAFKDISAPIDLHLKKDAAKHVKDELSRSLNESDKPDIPKNDNQSNANDVVPIPGKVTITDADVIVDVKNPVAIPGTITVDPTSVQVGNSDDLQKNANALSSVKQSLNKIFTSAEGYGTKIAAIGPSVQYVTQEVDNLSKSLENQITDLDLIAKKTDAYGTTANSVTLNTKDVVVTGDPVNVPVKATLKKAAITVPKEAVDIRIKGVLATEDVKQTKAAAPQKPTEVPGHVTLSADDVAAPTAPVNIPGKVTLKVEDVTPPKGSVKIPGKVKLKVSDITPPKTAIELEGKVSNVAVDDSAKGKKKNAKDDVKKTEVIDLKGKVELKDEDIERPNPLKLNGAVKIKAADVKIDDVEISKKEFDIKGNLILKNAEIDNAAKEAVSEATKVKKKNKPAKRENTKAANLNSVGNAISQNRATMKDVQKNYGTDYSFYSKQQEKDSKLKALLDTVNKSSDTVSAAKEWAKNNLDISPDSINSVKDAINQLNIAYREATQEAKDFNKEASRERSINKASMEVANLKATIHDYIAEHKKLEGTDVGRSLYELLEGLNQSDAPEKIGELKKKYAELRVESKKLGLESKNLLDVFEKLFGQHLSTMITMAALHKMQNALRIVYQNVVEIDTAVTELRKVSDYTGKSLEEYMGRAAEQAQKLGVSISDYIGSTADWKRLGYSDEDAENMATYSTLLKNVGDGIDDVNTSSSYLISTLQGFGLLAKDAENVVDQIDKVANTQPITAQAIGEILTRSAASMKAANNDLAETISLGTAAYAVIQNAETVGTTLKSVSMYLRAAKSELEDAGESADGCANSVSELRSELKSLTGVDIMIDNKSFKSTYQILKELSQVWDKLSDVTQANVTEMIGGKRNANAISAILNNFDVAESAMESAANSAGTAWEENSVWMDSIQGRLAQLDASFQVLSQDVLSSGLLKTGVSFLTSIVKLLDKIINLTGALPAGLGITAFATQLGKPKMTGFMIVPSNTPGGDTEQMLRRYFIISLRSMREYLVKPTNMVA
jgi:TP901 family phage tail tape measure protein